MTDKIVHSWKTTPEDREVLKALKKANKKAKKYMSESAMVRAGLRALLKEKGVIGNEV